MPDRNQSEESSQRSTTRAIPITLLDFKPVRRNTLVGFAKVRIGRTLIFNDVPVNISQGRRWASLPSKPLIDREGQALRDLSGKVRYQPIAEWTDRDVRDAFSDAVCDAVERDYPDAFASGEGAS
jgi:hypothetical protein